MRVTAQIKDAIIVFRLDKSTNGKITSGKERILQVYSFSKDQLEYASKKYSNGEKMVPKEFFDLADAVCFDCPFRGYLKCYTHKYEQYAGFCSMFKSLVKEFKDKEIPSLDDVWAKVMKMSKDRYIRFGTYGEPSLIPIDMVSNMIGLSKSHTGYTHQWAKKPEYHKFFMASTHSIGQANMANKLGYRSFIVTDEESKDAIQCPASKEMGYRSTCEKCGLCSGMRKGKKHIKILNHAK
jgi:hypothetical protein